LSYKFETTPQFIVVEKTIELSGDRFSGFKASADGYPVNG